MNHFRLLGVCLFLSMTGCRTLSPPQPAFPRTWKLQPLPELKGPIDASLPSFARLTEVKVVAGERGQLGVTWSREMDSDTMSWDESVGKFRVDGSDQLLAPSTRTAPTEDMIEFARKTRAAPYWATLPPEARRDVENTLSGKHPPLTPELLAEDETSLMAIVSPEAVVARHFLSRSAFDCGSFGTVDDLTYANGRWHLVLYTCPPPGRKDGKSGITLAEVDISGWRGSSVVAQGYGSCHWIFSDGKNLDLFWTERYCPFWALPGSGMERHRLNHVQIEAGRTVTRRTVYECPKLNLLGFIFEDKPIRLVRLDRNRYDLLLERNHYGLMWLLTPQGELMHTADVLSGWPSASGPLAHFWGIHSCAAVALPDRRLQLVWDVESDPSGDPFESRDHRIMENHLDAWGWSGTKEVAHVPRVSSYGVAAAAVQTENKTVVLVVWQGEGRRLTCMVGSGSGQWSSPLTTEMVIGEQNWLVARDNSIALVTLLDRNIYWSPIKISTGS